MLMRQNRERPRQSGSPRRTFARGLEPGRLAALGSAPFSASKKVDDISRHESKHNSDPKMDPKHEPNHQHEHDPRLEPEPKPVEEVK